MNVLVIDDDRQLGNCLQNYLAEKGHVCRSLWDGSTVTDWLERNPCDAIIMDIRMPEIDGITLTRRIREKHKTLPILISTGLGYEEEMLRAALDAGANGYVSKVMGPTALYMALLQIVGAHRDTRNGKAA